MGKSTVRLSISSSQEEWSDATSKSPLISLSWTAKSGNCEGDGQVVCGTRVARSCPFWYSLIITSSQDESDMNAMDEEEAVIDVCRCVRVSSQKQ